MKYYRLFFLFFILLSSCTDNNRPETVIKDHHNPLTWKVCTDKKAINFTGNDQGEEVCIYTNEELKAPAIFFTSTGCPNCGEWGNSLFARMVSNHRKDVVPIALHFGFGDTLTNEVVSRFFTFFRPPFSPFFFLGTKPLQGRNAAIDRGKIRDNFKKITDSLGTATINAASSCILNIKGDSGYAWFGGQYYGESDSKYHLSLYLLENHVESSQNGQDDNPYYHHHVLRKTITPIFGEPLEGKLLTGKKIVFPIEKNWKKENLYLVSVIWYKKEGKIINISRSY